jgi:hypothetical protein
MEIMNAPVIIVNSMKRRIDAIMKKVMALY